MFPRTKKSKALISLILGICKTAQRHPHLEGQLMRVVTASTQWGIDSRQLVLMDQWARASFLDGWLSNLSGHSMEIDGETKDFSDLGAFGRRGNPIEMIKGFRTLRESGLDIAEEWTDLGNQEFYQKSLIILFKEATQSRMPEDVVWDVLGNYSADVLNKGTSTYKDDEGKTVTTIGFYPIFYLVGKKSGGASLANPNTVSKYGYQAGVMFSRKMKDIFKSINRDKAKQRDMEDEVLSGDDPNADKFIHLQTWSYKQLIASLIGEAFAYWGDFTPNTFEDDQLMRWVREPAEKLVRLIWKSWEDNLAPSDKIYVNAMVSYPDDSDADILNRLGYSSRNSTNVQRARNAAITLAKKVYRRESRLADDLEFRTQEYIQQGTGGVNSWVVPYGSSRDRSKEKYASIDLTTRVAARAAARKISKS